MKLEDIFKEHGIELRVAKTNRLRNVVDVLEDMFLRLNKRELNKIMKKISKTESKEGPIFDEERGREYK